MQIHTAENSFQDYAKVEEALSDDGDGETLEQLLKAGADPNHENYLCRTADLAMTQVLVAHKADVNASDWYGTPLHNAVYYARDSECLDVVNLLLNAKANVNAYKEGKGTPLMYACSHVALHGLRGPILMRLLQHPEIEMNYVINESNAFHRLATHPDLNNSHMPALIKMLILGANPNVKGYVFGQESADKKYNCSALQRYCSWARPDCLWPIKTNNHVIKSAILILEMQRNRIRNTKEEVFKSTALANDLLDIITGYTCGIAPHGQELAEAIAAYKDVEPALGATMLSSMFSTFDA